MADTPPNPPDSQPPPSKHTVIAAWFFGSIILAFFMWIIVFLPGELPEYKQKMLAIISALLSALFTFFFVGSLHIRSKFIQAGGGAAAFALVLWWWNNPNFAPIKIVQTIQADSQIPTEKIAPEPDLPIIPTPSITATAPDTQPPSCDESNPSINCLWENKK